MKTLTRKTIVQIGTITFFCFSATSVVAYNEQWSGAANDGGNFANIANWSDWSGIGIPVFNSNFEANIGVNGKVDVFLDSDMSSVPGGYIEGGSLSNGSSLTIKEGGNLVVFRGFRIGDGTTAGVLDITEGGRIDTRNSQLWANGFGSQFKVSGGTVDLTLYSIYADNGATVTVSGGEINGYHANSSVVLANSATMTVTGGKINLQGDGGSINMNTGATMEISGGRINASNITMMTGTMEVNGSADMEVRNLVMINGGSEMKLYGGTLKWTGAGVNRSIWVANSSIVYLGDGANITAVDFPELKIETSSVVNINHAKSDYTLGAMVRLETGGTLNHVGTGTTILTSDGSVSGGGMVNVDKGTLQFGNGGSAGHVIGADVTVAGGATLAINRSDNVNLLGASGFTSLSGDGTIRKMGSGMVTVDAYAFYMDNGNAGLTFEIENGTYQFVGGGFDNTVTVLSHAAAGTSLDVTNAAVLSLGTLNVNGDVTLKLGNRHGNTNLLHIETLNGDAGKLLTLDISGLTLADLYQSGGDYCYDLLGVTDYSGFNGEIIAGLSDITDGEDTYTFEGYDWVGGKLVAMYSLGSPIPEPSSYAMIFGVAAAVAVTLRRRRK